ncbi:hypothetical protein V1264_006512 [Littorina saxatilis]|uniref:Uncharacterized protein n=2 Tax=Littorina saxatilis TaxID=31220 RepID=A0AAN9AX89_9CAEN
MSFTVTEGRESTSSVLSDHPSFFHANYRRLQALLTHVSSLAETANLLIQCTEPLLTGDSQDFRRVQRCAELIHKRAQQLVSCSSSDSVSMSTSLLDSPLSPQSLLSTSDTKPHEKSLNSRLSSNVDSVSILSDSQMEHLDFAAQEVMTSSKCLMNRVTKMSTPLCSNPTPVTPRGKRMLPVSPVKASASPKLYLQQASTRHTLSITSTTINC